MFAMIGSGQSGDDPVLQPGDYSYPFQFLIPNQNMPTSVEGSHGYVRYWLKGIIDRPWKFDITTTAVFTMLEYVDINTLPLLASYLHCCKCWMWGWDDECCNLYVNNSLHLTQKYAPISADVNCLFQEANSFPGDKLKENCELWETEYRRKTI